MKKSGFIWAESAEPHFTRRKEIIKRYPEVKKLFGIDSGLKYKTVLIVLLQLGSALFFLPESGWLFLTLSFVLGATLANILFLAIHEITHDLAFRSRPLNNWLAIVANIPLIFPFAMAFREYHAEHHWHQGKDKVDTDIPSRLEAKLFQGFFGKLYWMLNQIIFYAIRPVLIRPKKINKWILINVLVQAISVFLVIYFFGWYAVFYLSLSLFLAGGLHPIAGHFIAEHYVFEEGQETYSYYGPLNAITFNVGFHNEHHDFPNIPGTRLPKLKQLAPEYYDNLYAYNSWWSVTFRFLTDQSVSLYSRMKRAE